MKPVSVVLQAIVAGPRGGAADKAVRATVHSGISKAALADVASWKAVLRAHRQEDADWNWPAILQDYRIASRLREGRYEFVTLRAHRKVQSVMVLETKAHVGRRKKESIVYVEYLAVAPWNREAIQSPRVFSGCGSVMIEFAIRRSEELGYEGRVGLHSLPGSRTFYSRSGFMDLGSDVAEGGLHYFEYPD